jgi:hypothetical protein
MIPRYTELISGLEASSTRGRLLSVPSATVDSMTLNELLVVATTAVISGVAGNLFAPSVTKGLLKLATARAQRVEHVPVAGTDLYASGVPLTEAQFREAFAAMQAELDSLSPPAERSEWEMKRQWAAVNRLSALAGTYPHAFPILGNADDAWNWYRENNPYAMRDLPRVHGFAVQAPGVIVPPWQRVTH